MRRTNFMLAWHPPYGTNKDTPHIQVQEDAMETFIQQHEKKIIGVLSGFDRLVLTGMLRALAVTSGMMDYLNRMGVLLKEFGSFVEKKSNDLKAASLEAARRLDRPVIYLPSPKNSKEDMARQIAERDRIDNGLIVVLTSVEPCRTYEICRNAKKKLITLEPRIRKCLFLYHYWMDERFGFMHARIQTWYPFTIRVCLNGREWLSRQMDGQGITYDRRDNCFVWIEDVPRAQRLMDEQLSTDWPGVLKMVACRLNPIHEQLLSPYRIDYYWSTYQSEWATDIMFRSPRDLETIYPSLVRGGISAFTSVDVMRFLGKKLNGSFLGEVVSSYKKRPEGMRVKHQVKANSIKVYDKQGTVLRVETTLNEARDFKVFRPKEGEPRGPKSWRRMRKGVADLYERTRVSQTSNERYLEALASLRIDEPLKDLVAPLCKRASWHGQHIRPLRPWASDDQELIRTVSRGEFTIAGFRNKDLLPHLYGATKSKEERRRLAARVTFKLRLLRAHKLIRKLPHTHRYVLTRRGRIITTALLQTFALSTQKLTEIAA